MSLLSRRTARARLYGGPPGDWRRDGQQILVTTPAPVFITVPVAQPMAVVWPVPAGPAAGPVTCPADVYERRSRRAADGALIYAWAYRQHPASG